MECSCRCGDRSGRHFDEIAARELATPLELDVLCRQNIAWYCDRTLDDHHLDLWNLSGRSGLYFLWHKDDYCAAHQLFHMKALYVGKGRLSDRIKCHWANKPTEEQMLIYFTYAELDNRIAKYAEQLILDVYNVPMNHSENPGTRTLCVHFSQSEVD